MPAHCCRNPFHCIVPPHMLRVLEIRGDARQTEMARELLARGREVREEREELATATATYVTVDETRKQELRQQYGIRRVSGGADMPEPVAR